MSASKKTVVGGKRGFPARRVVLLALAALMVCVAVFLWPWISAQARAAVVLTSVLEPPVLTPAVGGLTGAPSVRDRQVAGVPTLVVRPEGEGPWPVLVFGNGAVPTGRHDPAVERLARGLARAGYLVYVPDVPGLRSGEISERTVSATVDVARAAAEDPEARDGRVGLVGVSVGGSLVLLAAQSPGLADRVSVVSVVAPYTDLKNVLRLATTGAYLNDGRSVRYRTPNYLRLITARSLVAQLPPGRDRAALLTLIPKIKYYYSAKDVSADPLAALPAFRAAYGGELSPQARSVLNLLINKDPGRFDELYAELPREMRSDIEELSPITGAGRIRAPVEIASAPRDLYFPVAGSEDLARRAPHARVTVTPALSHVMPRLSFDDILDFLRLDGFVVRSLRDARSG